MKINKPIENWTKYPNCVLDNLDQFSPTAFKVISFMIRKNLGFPDPNKQFSLSYIVIKTGLSKPTANKAIKELIELGSIEVIKTGKRGIKYFDIVWSEPIKKVNDRLKNLTTTGKEFLPEPVKKFNPVKENRVKENRVKDEFYEKCILIIEHWNTKKLQTHNKDKLLLEFKKKKYKDRLKLYNIEQWKEIINIYDDIVNDDKYWYTYKSQMKDFISRDKFEKFVPSENYNPRDNYKIKKIGEKSLPILRPDINTGSISNIK